uniref:Vasoactive intestinal peptide n=1 Tax=Varanus komodoensis TaxID=61221 RepID=A0A8D2LVP6_VARKO
HMKWSHYIKMLLLSLLITLIKYLFLECIFITPSYMVLFLLLIRLGNRLPFDGANEPDHVQASLKPEADILQTTLPENDKFYFDMSRTLDRNARHADGLFTSGYSKLLVAASCISPIKRHSDAVFTDNYSRFRKQMAMKKYLNSVLSRKRSQEELNPSSLRDEAELLDPTFSENYDDVTVDDLELLNHLPVVS